MIRTERYIAASSGHVPRQQFRCKSGKLAMVWYGMVNVDLYSAIITKVSNALNTLVSGEKPGFQAMSKGLIVLLCTEVVRQGVPDHGAVHSECSASNSGQPMSWHHHQFPPYRSLSFFSFRIHYMDFPDRLLLLLSISVFLLFSFSVFTLF